MLAVPASFLTCRPWSRLAASVAIFALAPLCASQPADRIFFNGSVLTADAEDRVAEALAVRGDRILAVGAEEAVFRHRYRSTTMVDLAGRSLIPGLIDSHTHLVFGGYRAEEFSWRLRGDSYMEIMQRGGGIVNTVKATRQASPEELIQTGIKRLDSMLSFGVTTAEGKSGYGLDSDTEIRQLEAMARLDQIHYLDVVPTFLGAHAVPLEYKDKPDAFIDLMTG